MSSQHTQHLFICTPICTYIYPPIRAHTYLETMRYDTYTIYLHIHRFVYIYTRTRAHTYLEATIPIFTLSLYIYTSVYIFTHQHAPHSKTLTLDQYTPIYTCMYTHLHEYAYTLICVYINTNTCYTLGRTHEIHQLVHEYTHIHQYTFTIKPICIYIHTNMRCTPGRREVGGWGRVPFSRNFMSPTPRRKWYLTTGRRAH